VPVVPARRDWNPRLALDKIRESIGKIAKAKKRWGWQYAQVVECLRSEGIPQYCFKKKKKFYN
jgi:hypothetical protein